MKVFKNIIIEITTNIIDFHFSYVSNNIKYFFNLFQNRNQTKTQAKRANSLTQKKENCFFGKMFFVNKCVDNMTTTKQTGSKFH